MILFCVLAICGYELLTKPAYDPYSPIGSMSLTAVSFKDS